MVRTAPRVALSMPALSVAGGAGAVHQNEKSHRCRAGAIRTESQRETLRFSAEVLPRLETSSYSTTCPSFKPGRPALSTAEM
jgi:hypothetical protein